MQGGWEGEWNGRRELKRKEGVDLEGNKEGRLKRKAGGGGLQRRRKRRVKGWD